MCNTWVNCMQGRVEKGLWEIRAQEVRRREILLQVRVFCPHFTSLQQLNFMQGSVGPSICAFIWHIGCLLRGAQYLRFVELVDKLSPNAGGSSPTGPFEEQGRGAADQCQGLLPVSWGDLHWPNRRRQVCINLVKSPERIQKQGSWMFYRFKQPTVDPAQWSHHKHLADDKPLTDNKVEGWHK